ncbi:transcriptional regulator, TetR family [Verrucomicrobium sp. GAS474]|uniref:TetR/AcrR family transcriptional regulator n=1 Tax=Verrucomicrobium sp. GAS474 TaxID=1882831 RepID=UPI00087D33D4|nr:TetR/AcrR family transcriptional regulator [Verrucomicrobium sp. GAS474]SDU24060.1 transcriptional regulator, TetR family [Verrucomicrobium sp. GAS474]
MKRSIQNIEKKPRSRGRPRAFDREAALDRAMELFWERGFEGTSLDSLTEAMGISTSSLYATFGDKERLFQAAIERYSAGPGAYHPRILREEPTARAAMARLFSTLAQELTRTDQPLGCMVSLAVVQASPAASPVRQALAAYRTGARQRMVEKLREGIASGELPEATDAESLAQFFWGVIQGMGAQARDGASRDDLERMGRYALQAFEAAGWAGEEERAIPAAKPSIRVRARRL